MLFSCIELCNLIKISQSVICFALLLGIVSCVKKQPNIDEHYSESIDLTEIPQKLAYDSIMEIPLSLPADEVIGDFSKIIFDNGKFFIMDSRQNRIWCFDRMGKYVGMLNTIGRGPGEYSRISDCDIQNGRMYILDVPGRKVLCYSTDTISFIKDYPIDKPGFCFAVGDSTHIYFENPMGNKDNIKLAINDNQTGRQNPILRYALKNESTAKGKGRTHFWRSGQNIAYYSRFTPTIYILGNDAVKDSIQLITSNLPSTEQIKEMITSSHDSESRPSRGDSPLIRDIRDVYMTTSWTSLNLYTTPAKLFFVDNSNGRLSSVDFDERLSGCRISAMGVADEFFITLKDDDSDCSLILYTLRYADEE